MNTWIIMAITLSLIKERVTKTARGIAELVVAVACISAVYGQDSALRENISLAGLAKAQVCPCESRISDGFISVRLLNEISCYGHERKRQMCIWINRDSLQFTEKLNPGLEVVSTKYVYDKEVIDSLLTLLEWAEAQPDIYSMDSLRYSRDCLFDFVEITGSNFKKEAIMFGGIDAAPWRPRFRALWLTLLELDTVSEK